MKRFWNIVHYFVYRFDYKFHLLFNKINPVYFFYKLPFAKKHFEKMGIDPIMEVNNAFKRPDFGISTLRTGGFMGVLIFILCLGIANLFSGISHQGLNLRLYHFIIFIVISIILNQLLLFNNNQRLICFKEYDLMSKELKIKWAWISFIVIFGILFFGIGSFIIASHCS